MTQPNPITNVAIANSVESSDKTLYDMTSAAGFSTLHGAIKAAGLKETLNADGPYTLFAPTDAAFEKLPPGTLDTLMKSENKDQLAAVLKNHIFSGRYPTQDAPLSSVAQTLDGRPAQLSSYVDASAPRANTACCNGVIHSIDSVVLPN